MLALLRKFSRSAILRVREAYAYCLSVGRLSASPTAVRVVIFAQGRTGSTLLENLLCSTGYFRENGELLDTEFGEVLFPIPFILGLSSGVLKRTNANFIFHAKIYQLTEDRKHPVDPGTFLERLFADGWKIIYLRRENKVNHALSNIVARRRGKYHKLDDVEEDLSGPVDCQNLIKRVNKRIRCEAEERAALANVSYHEVVYEDDLENANTHQRTVDRILRYLSLEHRVAATQYKKVNNLPPKALISNYDEFIACLTQQGWLHFLDQRFRRGSSVGNTLN